MSSVYYHVHSKRLEKEINTQFYLELIKTLNPDNFEFNTKKGVLKRDEWLRIFSDYAIIYEGMYWDNENNKAKEVAYIPRSIDTNWDSFIKVCETFFAKFNGKKLGVQLSGGLDSGIIIVILDYLKIPYYTVGLESKRFEFRTENKIQKILARKSVKSVLINFDSYLPFSRSSSIPKHLYPDIHSINFSTQNAMADVCENLGIEVLLTGDGGDNLFGESIPENIKYYPHVYCPEWHREFVYKPKGVELLSFYANTDLIDIFFNLRRGQSDDNSKKWARMFFSNILPPELSLFDYRADFWGIYQSGLFNELDEICKTMDKAYKISHLTQFSLDSWGKLISSNLNNINKENYQSIESRIALAIWINSLGLQ